MVDVLEAVALDPVDCRGQLLRIALAVVEDDRERLGADAREVPGERLRDDLRAGAFGLESSPCEVLGLVGGERHADADQDDPGEEDEATTLLDEPLEPVHDGLHPMFLTARVDGCNQVAIKYLHRYNSS